MPEMIFTIGWPDGSEEPCYSPSLVVKQHLAEGGTYLLPDFMQRVRAALTEASRRVQEKYGFPCSRALAQLRRLEEGATRFRADSRVEVRAFEE